MKSFLGLELVPESCLNLLQLPQSIRQLFVTTWCEEVSWPTWIKNSGSVKVSKDSILICQFHRFYQESIMWKIEIPSTILFKLVAHSSTENFVVIVVDRIDVAKPKGKNLNKIVRMQSTSTSSSWQEGPLASHGPTQGAAEIAAHGKRGGMAS